MKIRRGRGKPYKILKKGATLTVRIVGDRWGEALDMLAAKFAPKRRQYLAVEGYILENGDWMMSVTPSKLKKGERL